MTGDTTKAEAAMARVTQSTRRRRRILRLVLVLYATATFPFALVLPVCTIAPALVRSAQRGEPISALTLFILVWLGHEVRTTSYSVLGGIAKLADQGHYAVALLVVCFSVLFPATKLVVLWFSLLGFSVRDRTLYRAIERFGHWSMADVFIIALLLVALSGIPMTAISLNLGYYLFASSVLATIAATYLDARHEAQLAT